MAVRYTLQRSLASIVIVAPRSRLSTQHTPDSDAYSGGSDTVSDLATKGALAETLNPVILVGTCQSTSVLQSFFLAMTLYPDVVAKARESIDTAVGTDRLVDIADRGALPYITCVLKEVLR